MDLIANIVDTTKSYRIQETPYFKRLRLREESDLVHMREAKEIIEKAAENFLEPQIRQIRLKKLYEQIQYKIENSNRKHRRRRFIPRSSPNIARDRAIQAKRIGNEFSKRNRKTNTISKLFHMRKSAHTNGIKTENINSFNKRKEYGQHVKEYNKQNIENQKFTSTDKDEVEFRLKHEKSRKNEYGQYYSLRNRLNYKHSIKEFDDEYSDLLLQCLLFEKNHLDVCGFLEEQVRSSPQIRSKWMSKLSYSRQSSRTTISSYSTESDLTSLSSTTPSKSKDTIQSTTEDSTIRAISRPTSREIFDTQTKISSAIVGGKPTSEEDETSIGTTKSSISGIPITSKYVWKEQFSSNVADISREEDESSGEMEITESMIEDQERELGLHKFASVITKDSSFVPYNTNEPSVNNSNSNTTSNDEENTTQANTNHNVAGASAEQLTTKVLENQDFDGLLKSIFTHKTNIPNKLSLADEMSNLVVAFGRKMMQEANNGNVNQNVIKAFALKQQTSIRKKIEKLTRNF